MEILDNVVIPAKTASGRSSKYFTQEIADAANACEPTQGFIVPAMAGVKAQWQARAIAMLLAKNVTDKTFVTAAQAESGDTIVRCEAYVI